MYCTLLTWATQQPRKLGQARVEVLLRQQALKPKANSDEKKGAKPNYNKKVGSKITQLSTKATEIRCLQTNVESSTLRLAYVARSI